MAVGAPYDDDYGNNSGAVYIFIKNYPTTDNWGEFKKIFSSNIGTGGNLTDYFGKSVSGSGTYLIVGAPLADNGVGNETGSAYIFEKDEGSANNWGEQVRLTSDYTYPSHFGEAVSLDGNIAVVGEPYRTDFYGGNSGTASIFKRSGMAWEIQERVIASDPGYSTYFGFSVGVSGNTAIVGAPAIGKSTAYPQAYIFGQ